MLRLTKCNLQDTIAVMFEIEQTDMFRSWLSQLRDARAKARIAARVQRAHFKTSEKWTR
jgi:hypothetical protein